MYILHNFFRVRNKGKRTLQMNNETESNAAEGNFKCLWVKYKQF